MPNKGFYEQVQDLASFDIVVDQHLHYRPLLVDHVDVLELYGSTQVLLMEPPLDSKDLQPDQQNLTLESLGTLRQYVETLHLFAYQMY